MVTTVLAAVLPAAGADLEVREIQLAEPAAGQVQVRIAAAGVCHSDLSLADGTLRQPVPAVLGHEGAGTITAVGPDVPDLAVGDPVLLQWTPACRACWWCTHGEPHLCERAADAAQVPYATLLDGTPVYAGLGTGAFAEQTVVAAPAVLRLPPDFPLPAAALLGCAVLTGVGAVFRTAGVRPGESVVVLGLGGVGLSALEGARLAGADPVIAVDVNAAKEALARQCGASAFLVADEALSAGVRDLTGGRGADHAIECVGRATTIRQAWSLTRRGGQTVVVGIGGKEDLVSFAALELFYFARRIVGCVFGSSDPGRDIPELVDYWRQGRLDPGRLVTDHCGLEGIPDAFSRMRRGAGGRTLLVPGGGPLPGPGGPLPGPGGQPLSPGEPPAG